MFKNECDDWQFPFLWTWNVEDTTNDLNKPDFTNFEGGNPGLTKKRANVSHICEKFLYWALNQQR